MKRLFIVVDMLEDCEPDIEKIKDVMMELICMKKANGVSMLSGDEYALRKKIPTFTTEELVQRLKEIK